MSKAIATLLVAAKVAFVLICLAMPAWAESSGDKARVPLSSNVLEFGGGYDLELGATGKSAGNYRLVILGRRIAAQGTALTPDAKHLDLAENVVSPALNNRNGSFFRYENQSASAGGGLLEGLGSKGVKLAGIEKLGLLGTAYIGTDAKFKNLQVAVGLETKPRPILKNGWSNWVTLGINAQRQDQTDAATGDGNSGIFVGKAFLGKSFGPRQYPQLSAVAAANAVKNILAVAPDYETGRKAVEENHFSKNTLERAAITESVEELTPDPQHAPTVTKDKWEAIIKTFATNQSSALHLRDIVSLYAEGTGWFTFLGQTSGGRARGLFTTTMDYSFVPSRDDMFLRLRYENGFERAAPTVRKNHVLMSLGVKF